MLPVTSEISLRWEERRTWKKKQEWKREAFYHPLVTFFRGGGMTQRITN